MVSSVMYIVGIPYGLNYVAKIFIVSSPLIVNMAIFGNISNYLK
jgi:hypothetical protein